MRRMAIVGFMVVVSAFALLGCGREYEREQIEKELLQGNDEHDGSISLATIGDMGSVPALMHVLDDNRPDSLGRAECTYAHADEALRKITGLDAKWGYEGWKAWYATEYRPPRE